MQILSLRFDKCSTTQVELGIYFIERSFETNRSPAHNIIDQNRAILDMYFNGVDSMNL